jgi:hypothetical protein
MSYLYNRYNNREITNAYTNLNCLFVLFVCTWVILWGHKIDWNQLKILIVDDDIDSNKLKTSI